MLLTIIIGSSIIICGIIGLAINKYYTNRRQIYEEINFQNSLDIQQDSDKNVAL